MSFDVDTLYALLPTIYRIRDMERNGGLQTPLDDATQFNDVSMLPLRSLLAVVAEQIGVLEENLAQLYDDQFIETCAEWAVPYLGDLIGFHSSYDVVTQSQRTEVANTVNYRQRKGTATLIEQLVHDVTGWSTHVVEYFHVLASTQHMNLVRPGNHIIDLRHSTFQSAVRPHNPLEQVGEEEHELFEHLNTPFDRFMHTADVRSLSTAHRAYSIPSVGVFLWRLFSYPLQHIPAVKVDEYRYRINPLGNDIQLFCHPTAQEGEIHLARPLDIVMPLSYSMLSQFLNHCYGSDRSLLLHIDGKDVLPTTKQSVWDLFVVSDLSDISDDDGNITGWANVPHLAERASNVPDDEKIAIDPARGRIVFPRSNPPKEVYTSFYYGFSAEIGGGAYLRSDTFSGVSTMAALLIQVPNQQPTLQAAITALQAGVNAVIEITDSGTYREIFSIDASINQQIELRAAEACRPLMILSKERTRRTKREKEEPSELVISGAEGACITLNGLIVSGGPLRITGNVSRVTIKHCTFVPGLSLQEDGMPRHPTAPSLIIEASNVVVDIDFCIVGALRVSKDAYVRISNSIVDANEDASPAYTALDADNENTFAGQLSIRNSTVIGLVYTSILELASNTIFLGCLASEENDWAEPLYVEKRQEGSVRYSYIPPGSRVPHCYKCQPVDDADDMRPQFTSLRYSDPGYCQLSMRCPDEIRMGADDESEMGAFHLLYQPQREKNLDLRLKEYLRFDMQQGIGKIFVN